MKMREKKKCCKINFERLEKSIKSGFIEIPNNFTKEQIKELLFGLRDFSKNDNKGEI